MPSGLHLGKYSIRPVRVVRDLDSGHLGPSAKAGQGMHDRNMKESHQDGASVSEVKADDGGGEDLQLRVVRHKLRLRQPAANTAASAWSEHL